MPGMAFSQASPWAFRICATSSTGRAMDRHDLHGRWRQQGEQALPSRRVFRATFALKSAECRFPLPVIGFVRSSVREECLMLTQVQLE